MRRRPHSWSRVATAVAAAALVVGVAAASTAAKTSGPNHRVTVKTTTITLAHWSSSPVELKGVRATIAAFEKRNPSIKVNEINLDPYPEGMLARFAARKPPDIFYVDSNVFPDWVSQGVLEPISDDMAKAHMSTKPFYPRLLNAFRYKGKLYGLPLQVDLIGVYYNKTLMDKEGLRAPQTFDQLVGFCRQAKAKGYIPLAFSDNVGWQAFHQFSMVSNNIVGPEAMRKLLFYNQGSWNTSQMVRAIRLYFVDLQKAGCFSRNVNALGYDDANALFYTGKALMNPTGSWLVGDIERGIRRGGLIGMMDRRVLRYRHGCSVSM